MARPTSPYSTDPQRPASTHPQRPASTHDLEPDLHVPALVPVRDRDLGVYSLRGLAVLLMVAGHVIGWDATTGMRVADDSAWRVAYVLLEDVRMPLFTVLSGVVYAMRPLRTSTVVPRFLKGKARRLLIPLLTVGTAFFLLQTALPGTNAETRLGDVWQVWLLGYAHFWFAQSLFVLFVVLVVLELAGALATLPRWAAVLAITALGPVLLPLWSTQAWVPAWLSGLVWLTPFFLLGVGLRRFPDFAAQRGLLALAGVIGAAVLGARVAAGESWPPLVITTASTVGALLVLTVLVRAKDHLVAAPLAWLGQFSYGVYLLHVFGTAGTRLVLGRLGIETEPVVFLISLAAGIAFPVLVELALAPYRVPMLLVLGQKPAKRSSYAAVWREARSA